MNRRTKYPPELRERAIRMVYEQREKHESSGPPLSRWPGSALALQFRYGNLNHKGCCVEPIDHLWSSTDISGQFQRFDDGPVEQAMLTCTEN